jgi:hypothetical protein
MEGNMDKIKLIVIMNIVPMIVNADVRIDEITNLQSRVLSLEQENALLKNTFDQAQSLNSNVANYITLISIFLTVLAIAIPLLNYVFVIKPNRKIGNRLKNIEKEIPQKIDSNFEIYMVNFELKRINKGIEEFTKNNNYTLLSDMLFVSNTTDLTEEQCERIINKLNTGIEINDTNCSIIMSNLFNPQYRTCDAYFKSILEDEGKNVYLAYSIKYFTRKDISLDIKYLEKILPSRNDFEKVFVKLIDSIESEYLGDPFQDKRPIVEINIGEEKAKILLNNRRIVELFNPDKLVDEYTYTPQFFDNDNVVNFHPFYKTTYMFKKHYEEEYNKHNKYTLMLCASPSRRSAQRCCKRRGICTCA